MTLLEETSAPRPYVLVEDGKRRWFKNFEPAVAAFRASPAGQISLHFSDRKHW